MKLKIIANVIFIVEYIPFAFCLQNLTSVNQCL